MASSQLESKHDKDTSGQNPNEKLGDVMSHSFGEGYATRSDEEGYGGIYGRNQSFPQAHTEQDKHIHENHPVKTLICISGIVLEAYDKTQGSEVKEKEKARHQTSSKS
ncbi:hypothetical protein I3843_02G011500 [Carya illinoinensis]|nr:hypothetical protein I3843_02G011500 [Carya illinoinensis]